MKKYTCDTKECKKEFVYAPTVVYARAEGPSKKAELCADCGKKIIELIAWQPVVPRNNGGLPK